MDINTTLKTLSLLSKNERESLKKSHIARVGKKLHLDRPHQRRNRPQHCLLHDNRLPNFMAGLEIGLNLCESVQIDYSFGTSKEICWAHNPAYQNAFLIASLPKRFDKKISVVQRRTDISNFDLEVFC